MPFKNKFIVPTIGRFLLNIYHFFSTLDAETQATTDKTRKLGLTVVRGTQVSLISPQNGVEEIANPFLLVDDDVIVDDR
jgi:hypothetical protein